MGWVANIFAWFMKKTGRVEEINENSNQTIMHEPIIKVKPGFNWEEIHAYNCLIFSNEKANEFLREIYRQDADITLEQAHYAAWLIESKSYTGITDTVAESLLKKLRNLFIF